VSGIEWRDPSPRSRGGNSLWCKLLGPLVERPNEWAMVRAYDVAQDAYQAVSRLRAGMLKTPPGRWEFAGRNGEVFARYLGEES
jgi:hypothetical protein